MVWTITDKSLQTLTESKEKHENRLPRDKNVIEALFLRRISCVSLLWLFFFFPIGEDRGVYVCV